MIDDETIRHRRKTIRTFFFTYRKNPIDSNYLIDFFLWGDLIFSPFLEKSLINLILGGKPLIFETPSRPMGKFNQV